MWDGRQGRVNVAKQRYVLNFTHALPILSVPYHADPKQWELQRDKIEKTRVTGVAKPLVEEWSSPILFVPKRIAACGFATTADVSKQLQNERTIQSLERRSALIH